MRQVDWCVAEKNSRCAEHGLLSNRQHLLICRMNIEPLIRAHLQGIHIGPHCDVLKLEALLQTLHDLSCVEIGARLV